VILLWKKGNLIQKGIQPESPITKHVPIIEKNSIFSSFLNQIEGFWCHWMHKLEGYKNNWSIRSRRAILKIEEEDK
jgi:hypothetical protein